ncbi:MAG: hypothetical protein HY774_29690 [Acidobacteria bacterium]|nr:hypothetical protein [Acidobacteriota bacterium]
MIREIHQARSRQELDSLANQILSKANRQIHWFSSYNAAAEAMEGWGYLKEADWLRLIQDKSLEITQSNRASRSEHRF